MSTSLEDFGISRHSIPTGTALTVILVFISLAFYNVVELNIFIFNAFKRRKSLYFWSFVISTWGIALHQMGFLLKNLDLMDNGYVYTTLIFIGWVSMVTGQAFVLYSRLHIIMHNQRSLRAVLIMIIFNAIICHIPITVMVYGANTSNPEPFVRPYSIYEKFQVTVFFIQECIISGLYIWETSKIMQLEGSFQVSQRTKKVLKHLLYVNVIIIVLDITVLALEYASLYAIQTVYKGFAYSVKLKLEFSILNRLVRVMKTSRNQCSFSSPDESRAVALNTADTDRSRNTTAEMQRTAIQYAASVQAESHRGTPTRQNTKGVIKTTEVVVSRDTAECESGDIAMQSISARINEAVEWQASPSGSGRSRGGSSTLSSDV